MGLHVTKQEPVRYQNEKHYWELAIYVSWIGKISISTRASDLKISSVGFFQSFYCEKKFNVICRNWCVTVKIPLLTKRKLATEKNVCKVQWNWTLEMWCKVFWTDESKWAFFRCKRIKNQWLRHTGGSVQVWDSIRTFLFGDLVLIEGIRNSDQYRTYWHTMQGSLDKSWYVENVFNWKIMTPSTLPRRPRSRCFQINALATAESRSQYQWMFLGFMWSREGENAGKFWDWNLHLFSRSMEISHVNNWHRSMFLGKWGCLFSRTKHTT